MLARYGVAFFSGLGEWILLLAGALERAGLELLTCAGTICSSRGLATRVGVAAGALEVERDPVGLDAEAADADAETLGGAFRDVGEPVLAVRCGELAQGLEVAWVEVVRGEEGDPDLVQSTSQLAVGREGDVDRVEVNANELGFDEEDGLRVGHGGSGVDVDVAPVVSGVDFLLGLGLFVLLGLEAELDLVACCEGRRLEEDGGIGEGHTNHERLELVDVARGEHVEVRGRREASLGEGVDDACDGMMRRVDG